MKLVFHYTPPAEVHLISAPEYPADTLARVTRGYSGVYENFITTDQVEKFLEDLRSTKLQTPNAFLNFVWLLKNVTRNFEQQLTRYRVGTAFVAESLRFSEKRNAEFYVSTKTPEGQRTFEHACTIAVEEYEDMLKNGVPVQDARGVLPGNICTHMFVSTNLQTLQHIYTQRMCCQAQADEWGVVLAQMKKHLEEFPGIAEMLQAPWENPDCIHCGFKASFDRPCTNQKKFDRNLEDQTSKRLGLFVLRETEASDVDPEPREDAEEFLKAQDRVG